MITTQEILAYLPNKNYDPALLEAVLPTTQLIYIQKMLGADFYNQLVTQYNAGTLTSANETLLDTYIKPILALYTIYDSLGFLSAEPTSNGIVNMYQDNSNPAGGEEKGYNRSQLLSRASKLVDLCEKYLRDNASLYPLYSCGKDIKGNNFPIFYDSDSSTYIERNR